MFCDKEGVVSNEELIRKMLSDECPPGKFCHALCHDIYSNEDGRRDDCIACWTAWINENGLPEKIKPKTVGDMTLGEVREYCRKHFECDKCVLCCNLSGYDCEFDVDAPAGLDDETLNKPINVDNDEDKY